MPRLPVVSGDEATRAFAKAGLVFHHYTGRHAILYHADGRHLSVPGGRKELRPGTLRALIRDAGLTVEQFSRLLPEK